MASKSKRQQTAAKRTREHAVREKRELKQQKKQAAAAERRARAADPNWQPPVAEGEEVEGEEGTAGAEEVAVDGAGESGEVSTEGPSG